MKYLPLFIVSMILFGSSSIVQAVIVNLDGRNNTSPNPQVYFFSAGEYDIIPIGKNQGGNYDALSLWLGYEWTHRYSFSSIELGRTDIGGTVHPFPEFPTPSDALANAISSSFTLTYPQEVSFFITDSPASDNREGISLSVTPEPATLSLFALGAILAGRKRK